MQETRVNEEAVVMVPMVLDLDSIAEHGKMMGVTGYTWYRIGNRRVPVMLVPGTEEQRREIISSYEREFKGEDRSKRCPVAARNGKLKRCPDNKNCDECQYYRQHAYPPMGTMTFSDLNMDDGEGNITEYDPETPAGMYQAERMVELLDELIDTAEKMHVGFGAVIEDINDQQSRKTISEKRNIPRSTLDYRMNKLKEWYKKEHNLK